MEIKWDNALQYKKAICIGPLSASHHFRLNFGVRLSGPFALLYYCCFLIRVQDT